MYAMRVRYRTFSIILIIKNSVLQAWEEKLVALEELERMRPIRVVASSQRARRGPEGAEETF
jgi:hypothetical protein